MNRRSVLSDALQPLLAEPGRTGVFCDFDGTMSEIVDDPASAAPIAGAVEALAELDTRFAKVAVISGRPLAFLERRLPTSLLLVGLYGLELSDHGVRHDHPQSGSWREVIDDVASMAEARGPAGMRVENKGLSITLHFRNAPEIEAEVQRLGETLGARSGLRVRPAKMSVELHPPIEADKGTILLDLADDLRAVCFIGDDVGDLPAFDALDVLQARGVDVVRVAVRGAEESEPLVARADVRVDGPAGVLALLQRLGAAAQGSSSTSTA